MKKWTLFVMVLLAVSLVLWGCGEKKVKKPDVPQDKTNPKGAKDKKGAKDEGAKDEKAAKDEVKDDEVKDDDVKDDDVKDDDVKDDDGGEVASDAHPWANAKAGDMVEYKMHMKMPKMEMDSGMRLTVVSNDGDKVVHKMESMDKNGKVNYTKEDAEKSLKMDEKYKTKQAEWKKTGTENVTVDGTELSCDVLEGPTGKIWMSKKVCGGMVKMQTKSGGTETTMTLVKFVKN